MARKPSKARLSAGEIDILQMLWREGSVTLSEAHRAFGRPIGYTTVQTRLNRLVEKGIVTRTKDRPAIYRPAIAPEDHRAAELDLLASLESGGSSVVPLVAHLVRDRALLPEEIKQLKRLITEAERSTRSAQTKRGRR